MEDQEFIDRLKEKVEDTAGTPIDFHINREEERRLSIDFSGTVPKVVFGSGVLTYPGLARMFSQFAILCLKEGRQVSELEFLTFLRRN